MLLPFNLPFMFGLARYLMRLASASPALESIFRRWSLMGMLGNASYSINLAHLQFEKIFLDATRLLAWLWQPANQPSLAADALFLFVSAAAVACGVVIHLKIEKPLLTFLRERLKALQCRS